MKISHEIQTAWAAVRGSRAVSQRAILARNEVSLTALALAGESLAVAIAVIQKLEPAGIVKPAAMRRAFNREYGHWNRFASNARASVGGLAVPPELVTVLKEEVPMAPNSSAATDSLGISDNSTSGINWGKKA